MLHPIFCATNHSKTPPTTDPSPSLHDQSQQSSAHHQPIPFSALPITTKHTQKATNHIKAAPKGDQSHKSFPIQSDKSLQNTLPPSGLSQQSIPHIAANQIKAPHHWPYGVTDLLRPFFYATNPTLIKLGRPN